MFELGTLKPPSALHHRAQSPSCWSLQLRALRRGPSAPSQLINILNSAAGSSPTLDLTPPGPGEVLDPVLLAGHPGPGPFPYCGPLSLCAI